VIFDTTMTMPPPDAQANSETTSRAAMLPIRRAIGEHAMRLRR
jgi:hypothetical protein